MRALFHCPRPSNHIPLLDLIPQSPVQELMDMLFDQVVDIQGVDMPVALPFSKVGAPRR